MVTWVGHSFHLDKSALATSHQIAWWVWVTTKLMRAQWHWVLMDCYIQIHIRDRFTRQIHSHWKSPFLDTCLYESSFSQCHCWLISFPSDTWFFFNFCEHFLLFANSHSVEFLSLHGCAGLVGWFINLTHSAVLFQVGKSTSPGDTYILKGCEDTWWNPKNHVVFLCDGSSWRGQCSRTKQKRCCQDDYRFEGFYP